MLEFIAIVFPLLVAFLLVRIYPFTLKDFFTQQEQESLEQSRALLIESDEANQSGLYAIVFLACLLVFGAPFAYAQYYLIMLAAKSYPNVLFSNYDWSLWLYGFLGGLFLSIVVSGHVFLSIISRFQGREAVRAFLQSTQKGMPNYWNVKYYKHIALMIGLGVVMINFFASGVFVRVSHDKLYYSHFFSLKTYAIDYQSIDCIIRYSRRITPIGSDVKKAHLDIHMVDGDVLDTFYLLEGYQHGDLVSAIEFSAYREIPYLEYQTVKMVGQNDVCKSML